MKQRTREEWESKVLELYCNTFTQSSDWIEFIKEEIRKAEEKVLKNIKEGLEHHSFCKRYGKQYKECALCYFERKSLEALKK